MAPPSYTDYVKILAFYKMNIPKSKRRAKLDAEAILGRKLCRCIKKVKKSKHTIFEIKHVIHWSYFFKHLNFLSFFRLKNSGHSSQMSNFCREKIKVNVS